MLAAVLSDTHGQTEAAIRVLQKYTLDALFFLGDFYADGEKIQQSLPREVPLFAVAGNGDTFLAEDQPTEQTVQFRGKTFFLTHGHLYRVKKNLDLLLAQGEQMQADAVLFGHTHIPFLAQNQRGMWLLNPGSASFPRGMDDATFALLEWEENGPLHLKIVEVASGQLLFSSTDF